MFALIAIGIFVVVILVLMGREHEKKLVLAWAEVAQRFDLAQVKPMELIGEVDGISVHADVFHTGSGKNRQTWTRVVIEGGLTRAVGLAKEGFFSRAFGHDIATGDRSFDEAVKVQGDETTALALLDEHTRRAFQSAVVSNWTFEDGRWTLKVSGRLGPELGTSIEVGLSLARLTQKGQGELPERLVSIVANDSVAQTRKGALECLLLQYSNTSLTQKALVAALEDPASSVRLVAAERLGDLAVLSNLAADEANEVGLRVDAFEALVRRGPEDPRTVARVEAWLAVSAALPLRKAAVEAAATVVVADVEMRLLSALEAPDDDLKLAAMRSLGVVGTVEAVPALIPYRDKFLAFTLKPAAKEAIMAIQARVAGADAGALSLAGDGGTLALSEVESSQEQED